MQLRNLILSFGFIFTFGKKNNRVGLSLHPCDHPMPCVTFNPADFNFFFLLILITGGSAYCFGAVNRSCWYLYTLNPLEPTLKRKQREPDQTLEILMTNLDTSVSN